MGLLRLLLALAVVLAHSDSTWKPLGGGGKAVEAFFIISGFYMALILNEKYVGPGSTWLFYSNRIWRLFPLYWLLTFVIFAISLLLWKTGHDPAWLTWWLKWHSTLSPGSWVYLVSINLLALGQDTVFFFQLNHTTGQMQLVKDFTTTDPPIYRFLLVGQAWTLAVECYFYLLAPFLVRLRPVLLGGLFLLFFAFRLRLSLSSFGFDPWIGRFFPSELVFFLAGALGYLAYIRIRMMAVPLWLMQGALVLVVVLTGIYQWLPESRLTPLLYFTIFSLSVPLVFNLTKKSKRDAYIGEYSFPIYIAHTLPLYFLQNLAVQQRWSSNITAVLEVACVLPVSWFLIQYIGDPIEKIRARRAKKLLIVRSPQPI